MVAIQLDIFITIAVLGCTTCSFKGGVVPCTRAERDRILHTVGGIVRRENAGGCFRARQLQKLEKIYSGEHRQIARPNVLLDALPHQPRMTLIDAGCRSFKSSTLTLLSSVYKFYRFQRVFAFDMSSSFSRMWQREAQRWRQAHNISGTFEISQAAVSSHDGYTEVPTEDSTSATSMLSLHEQKSNGTTKRIPVLNFTRWLLNTVDADEYVVVKMDIEGAEYNVLPELLGSKARYLVDELWIEMHHTRQSVHSRNNNDICTPATTAAWEAGCKPCINRDEAVSWMRLMRESCIAAHDWH